MNDDTVKINIVGTLYKPPYNEPWKREYLLIEKITHYYKDGGFNEYINNFFGIEPEIEFYQIVSEDCELTIKLKERAYYDNYYDKTSFVKACYNRDIENPYQLPKWTTI